MTLASPQFDYATLDRDARTVVTQKTTEIRDRMGRAAQNIVEIGERLLVVKDAIGHGNFGAWLTAEFEWSESAATKMMQVAARFKSVNFTDLTIAPSALYLLASNSTPAEVRDKFIADAAAGKPVTHAEVKRAVSPPQVTFGTVNTDAEPTAADTSTDADDDAAERKAANKAYADNAPLAALEAAEAAKPRTWGDRTIPADAPPLDIEATVANDPGLRWTRIVSDIQGCIARLPDRATLAALPADRRRYIAERFKDFAKQMKEAV